MRVGGVGLAALPVLAAFTTAPPHRRKVRIPPGPVARAAADALRATTPPDQREAVIDLATYAAAAAQRRTLP